jgi:hypothetical protein
MPLRVSIITGAALLVLIAACATTGVAAAECQCLNGGTMTRSSPCECTCVTPYVLPACEWKSSDMIPMIIIFSNTSGATALSFSTTAKAYAIMRHFGIEPSASINGTDVVTSVRRRTAFEPADLSELHVIYSVRGDLVNTITTETSLGSNWTQALHMLRAYRFTQAPSPASPLAGAVGTLFTFTVMGATGTVTWTATSWAIGGLITVVCLPVVEAICSALCFSAGGGIDEGLVHEDNPLDGVTELP